LLRLKWRRNAGFKHFLGLFLSWPQNFWDGDVGAQQLQAAFNSRSCCLPLTHDTTSSSATATTTNSFFPSDDCEHLFQLATLNEWASTSATGKAFSSFVTLFILKYFVVLYQL
jgi:hypothetical protein